MNFIYKDKSTNVFYLIIYNRRIQAQVKHSLSVFFLKAIESEEPINLNVDSSTNHRDANILIHKANIILSIGMSPTINMIITIK